MAWSLRQNWCIVSVECHAIPPQNWGRGGALNIMEDLKWYSTYLLNFPVGPEAHFTCDRLKMVPRTRGATWWCPSKHKYHIKNAKHIHLQLQRKLRTRDWLQGVKYAHWYQVKNTLTHVPRFLKFQLMMMVCYAERCREGVSIKNSQMWEVATYIEICRKNACKDLISSLCTRICIIFEHCPIDPWYLQNKAQLSCIKVCISMNDSYRWIWDYWARVYEHSVFHGGEIAYSMLDECRKLSVYWPPWCVMLKVLQFRPGLDSFH